MKRILLFIGSFAIALSGIAQVSDLNFDAESTSVASSTTSQVVGTWTFTSDAAVDMSIVDNTSTYLISKDGDVSDKVFVFGQAGGQTTYVITGSVDFDMVSMDIESSASTIDIRGLDNTDTEVVALESVDLTTSDATGNISFTYAAGNSGTLSFGSAFDNVRKIEISVTGANDVVVDNIDANNFPAIAIASTTLGYTENDGATQVDAASTLTDADGDADWDGGTLVAQITANNEAADELSIPDGSINTDGTDLRDGTTVIGSLSASEGTVTNGTALTITFNGSATNALVEATLRAISYRSTSDNPGTSDRTVTFTATDVNGISASDTRTISVTAENDIPVFANLDGNPTFVEDGTAVVLDANVEISDAELDVADDYTGSSLVISRNGGADATDDFDFSTANNLALNGTDLELSSSVIGTFIESSGTLTLTFTGSGTAPDAATIDLVLQQITYQNTSNNPPSSVTLDWTFSDGDGGSTSGTNQTVVNITSTNDAPVISNLDATSANTFDVGGSAIIIDADVTISDPELDDLNSANGDFDGATIVISRNTTPSVDDVFSLSTSGTYSLSTNDISDETGVIGTFVDNGSGTLTITFSNSAHIPETSDVSAVLQLVQYENTNGAPPSSITLDITVDDGEASNNTITESIVVNINTAPVISGLDASTSYTEDGAAIILDADATFTDSELDALNSTNGDYDGASITVVRQSGANGNDSFTLATDATYALSGTTLEDGGTAIGTFTDDGSGTLTIVFNNASQIPTTADVAAVFQLVEYANSNDVPPASVLLDVTISDGSLENTGSIEVNITPSNDPPVITGLDAVSANTFTENGSAIVLDADATFSDPELDAVNGGNGDYDGATITISRNGGASADDSFTLGTGSYTLSGNDIQDAGNVIGTFVDDGAGTLTITFDNTAFTPETADIAGVFQLIEYTNSSEAPATSVDLDVVISDGTLSDTETIQVTITPVNDAPVLTGLDGTSANTYSENGTAVVLDANVVVSDDELDATSYDAATITIIRNGGANTDDVFANSGSLSTLTQSGTFNLGGGALGDVTNNSSGTLVLTFNATITANQVDEVLQSITYANSSEDPPTSVDLDWTFDDGAASDNSVTETITVNITQINDEPTITVTNSTPTFYEGDGSVDLFSSVTIDPIEAADDINGIVIEITNVSDGDDELIYLDGEAIPLGTANTSTTSANSFGYTVTLGSPVSIAVSGTKTEALYATLIDNLAYENLSNTPSTGLSRAISLNDLQDNSGTANGGDDINVLGGAGETSTVSVIDQPEVKINEVVTDPQTDWSTNGFDGTDGEGSISEVDEYIELYVLTAGINFETGSGWTIQVYNDDGTTPRFSGDLTNTGAFEVVNYLTSGAGTINFSEVGDIIVLGNPTGGSDMTNTVDIELLDENGRLIDRVDLGGGAGQAPTGNASDILDEAVSRNPNASDTDADDTDFVQQYSTIGLSNDVPGGYTVTINQNPINSGNDDAVTFTFTDAQVSATYNYSFTSSGGGAAVSGSGTISSATELINNGGAGFDLTGLGEGTVTLSVYLTDGDGDGLTVTDQVIYDRTLPTLTDGADGGVSIVSDNANTSFAKVGDDVIITIDADEDITSPTITIDGNAATITNGGDADASTWVGTYTTQSNDNEGVLAFTVNFTDLNGNPGVEVTNTTDASSVTFDETAPKVSNIAFFDTDNDGYTERVDITFSEIVSVQDASLDIDDFGFVILPSNDTISAATISSPAGDPTVVSLTDVVGQLTIATGPDYVRVDEIVGLWEDQAGNLIVDDVTETVTDNADPVIAGGNPADGAVSFDPADLVVAFSEPVVFGTSGSVEVNLLPGSSGVLSYDVASPGTDLVISQDSLLTINENGALTIPNNYELILSAASLVAANDGTAEFPGTTITFTANDIQPDKCGFAYTAVYGGESPEGALAKSNCNVEPDSISSLVNTSSGAISVFYFNISNGSDNHEFLDNLIIRNGNSGTVNWTNVIAGAQLISDEGDGADHKTITADAIEFDLDPNNIGQILGENDNGGQGVEFALRIWLKTDMGVDTVDIDNKELIFLLQTADISGVGGGDKVDRVLRAGSYRNEPNTNISSGGIVIDVDATQYGFAEQPTETEALQGMDPDVTVEAEDVNGNRDLDYDQTETLSITSVASSFAGAVSTSGSFTAGLTILDSNDSIVFKTPGDNFTLEIDPSGGLLTNSESSVPFDITCDVTPPNVSESAISIITSGSGDSGTFKIGDVVTARYDNKVDKNPYLKSVNFDFSAFGGGVESTLSNSIVQADSIFEASYTIVAGAIDASNLNVTVTGTDSASVYNDKNGACSDNTTAIAVAGTDNVTVDNTKPTVSSYDYDPTNGGGSVETSADLILTFDEDVLASFGNINIVDDGLGTQSQSFSANNTSYVSIVDNVVTISAPNAFVGSNDYYVLIDATAFTDIHENPYDGIANSATWAFMTKSDEEAPELTINVEVDFGTSSVTKDPNIVYEFQWNEEVKNFDLGDISVTVDGTLSSPSLNFDQSGTQTYILEVSGLNGDGDVTLNIVDNGLGLANIQDVSGNANEFDDASYVGEPTVTIDQTAPTVAVNAVNTNIASPELTGEVSEALDVTVQINGESFVISAGDLTGSAPNLVWTLAAGDITDLATEGNYSIIASATDEAGNTGQGAGNLLYDDTAPTIFGAYFIDTGLNPDGVVDEIMLYFNENIDDSSFDPSDWTFDGAASVVLATTIDQTLVTDNPNDRFLTLEVTGYTEGTATSNVDHTKPGSGGISDLVGNVFETNSTITEYDYADPQVVQTHQYDTDLDGNLDEIVVEFTEGVRFSSVNADAYTVLNSSGTSPLGSSPALNDLDVETLDKYITLSVDVPGTAITTVSYDQSSFPTQDASSFSRAARSNADIASLDKAVPVVIEVNSLSSDADTLIIGNSIEIYADFSEIVDVSGLPTLDLETGTGAQATYNTGDGTSRLIFDYTVGTNDESSDLSYTNTSALSGTIDDQSPQNNAAPLTLFTPGEPGSLSDNRAFIVDGIVPTFVQAHFYDLNPIDGDIDEVVIEMSEPVYNDSFDFNDFDLVTGTVTAVLNENGAATAGAVNTLDASDNDKYVTLGVTLSGSLPENVTYTGTVAGSLVRDWAGNTVAAADIDITTILDNAPPRVQSISTSVANDTFGIDQVIPVLVNFSENVTVSGSGLAPTIRLETGTFDQQVNYTSGSNTSTLRFDYTVSEGDATNDLDYTANNSLQSNEQSIEDDYSNTSVNTLPVPGDAGSLGNGHTVVIDGVRPSFVQALQYDTDGDGNIDEIVIEMSEPIDETSIPSASADTRFTLGSGATVDGISLFASGDIANTTDASASDKYLTLEVTVDGSAAVTVQYTGGGSNNLTDRAGNTAANNPSISVLDEAIPIVTSVTSSIADDAYKAGELIPIQVNFSEVVSYTTGGGTPYILLETGTTTTSQQAALASGNGTKILVFNYTVQANDQSNDLNYFDDNALQLNGGTITDQSSNSIATSNALAYATDATAPNTDQSLGALKNIVIDTDPPGITSLTIVSNNTTTSLAKGDDPENEDGTGIAADIANTVTITMDFNDDLIAAPTVQVRSNNVIVANALDIQPVGATEDQYTVTFDVSRNDVDGDISFTIDYTDKAGNPGTQLDEGDLSGSTVTIDNTNPTVSFSVDDNPTSQATFTVTALFSEAVSGLVVGDFTASNGVIDGFTNTSGNEYEFDVTPTVDQTNTITIGITDESVTDLVGNTIVGTTFDVNFDDEAPVITSSIEVFGQDLTATIRQNEIGKIYYVLVPDGNGASAVEADVKTVALGGSSANISNPITDGFGVLDINVANVDQVLPLSLPDPREDYDLLLVSEDEVEPTPYNLSSVTSIDVKSGGVVVNNPNLNNFCLEGDYFTLGDITISETITTDFVSPGSAANRTIRLVLPDVSGDGISDFEFRTVGGSESVGVAGGDLANASLAFTSSSILTITYQVQTVTNLDVMTISGLEIKATGSTTSNATIQRSGGNGNIYLANDGDDVDFATLNTIAPYAAATTPSSEPAAGFTAPYLFEITSGVLEDGMGDGVTVYEKSDVETTLTPFRAGLPTTGDVITIYSDAALMNQVATYTATTNEDTYLPTLADLGLDDTDVGVNTFYITTTDGESCESAATKYSVAIIRVENSEGKTGYAVSDGTGTTLKYSFPTGHTRLNIGNGLTGYDTDNDFTSPDEDGSSVRFIPSAAGQGTHVVTYQLTNSTSNVTANYGIEFLVIESDKVLSTTGNQAVDYCQDEEAVTLNMVSPSGIDYNGDPDGDESGTPDFKTVRVYLYDLENETRGDEISGILTTRPTSLPNDTLGWVFDPSGVDSLLLDDNYRQDLQFVYVIEDDGTGEETELSEQIITVYREPTVTITNMNEYYCNDDGDFDITAQIISDSGTETLTISDYILYKGTVSGTDTTYAVYGQSTGAGDDANFNPADPDNDGSAYPDEEEFGLYRIEYTSPARTNASCSATITYDFEILEIPALPTLVTDDFPGHSDGDLGSYTIEYCAGETVNSLTMDLSAYTSADSIKINWYTDANLTSSIASSNISGDNNEVLNLASAFFGGNDQPTGRQNVTFYYTITDNIDIDEDGYAGCESESKTISLQVYPVPGQPVAEGLVASTTTNTFNSKDVTGEYFYEYCVTDGETANLETVDLDETLNTEDASESFFILYDEDANEMVRFQDPDTLTDAVIKDIFSYNAADSTSLVFYVSQKNFDNNYPTGTSEFEGCEGETRKFTIDINAIPDTPASADFNGYDNEGVVEYYLCSGDNLENILTPQIEGAKYNWYQDDNGSPSSTVVNVSSFNDNFVRQSELTAVGFTNSVTTETTFTYWVTQTVDANTASGFKGCESDTLRVNITVFPDPTTPTIDADGQTGLNSYEASFCEGSVDFSYNVVGRQDNTDDVTFNIYSFNNGNISTSPVYTINDADGQITITQTELRLAQAEQGVYEFRVAQVNTSVTSNGTTIFEGCESEVADMTPLTFYIYDVPEDPEIGTDPTGGSNYFIYYNEGDDIADIKVTGESNAIIYRWYNSSTNELLLEDTTAAGSSSASAAQLGISGAGVYEFAVDQTSDYGQGVADFAGCTSSSETFTVTVFELPTAPVTTDPASQCNTQLTPNSTRVVYSGVETSTDSETRFYFYDDTQSEQESILSQNPDLPATFTVSEVDVNYGNTQVYVDTTIYIQQVTNIIPGEFEGSPSELSEVSIVVAPIPVIGDYGAGNQFNIIEACDNALVTLDVKLINVLVEDATFSWSAGNSENSDSPITPVSSTELSDYEVRFEFDPSTSGLGAGDKYFEVAVTDTRRPTDLSGCVQTASMSFEIGTSPIPKLRWEGITEGRNTTLVFGDDNSSQSANYWIDSIYVDIPDIGFSKKVYFGRPESTVDRSNLLTIDSAIFDNAGQYNIEVTYISGSACLGSLVRTITILDHFVVTDNIGFSFEGEDVGEWFAEYVDGFKDLDTLSWELGSSDFDGQSRGGSYWVTGNNGKYGDLGSSWVYSPSFDLSGMSNPSIGFDHARDLNFTDGVVFQQSLDDGRTWSNVGSFKDGLGSGKNWYTTVAVNGSPGGTSNPEAFAWSRKESWATSAHRVDSLFSQVRFRFALGNTGGDKVETDGTDLDGFAFDDFRIYNKDKFILIEQFSDFGKTNSVIADTAVINIIESRLSSDAILLTYLTSDELVEGRSDSDPSSRASYYGIQSAPQSILTGRVPGVAEGIDFRGEDKGWNQNYYNSVALDEALFEISDMTFGDDPGVIDLTASFTYTGGVILPAEAEISFRFAVVEKQINDPDIVALNGGVAPKNVLRTMLPNSGGLTYKGRVTPNQAVFFNGNSEVNLNWGISEIYDASELMVIAFVQIDNLPTSFIESNPAFSNRLVLQAKAQDVPGKVVPEVTGVVKIPNLDQFEIYPNPANKSFKVQLESAPGTEMNWVVYDQVGRKVITGAVKPGELEVEVDSRELPSGVYMIHFFNSEEKWQPKRLIILH